MTIKMVASVAIFTFQSQFVQKVYDFFSKMYKANMKQIYISIIIMIVALSVGLYLMWPASEILNTFRTAPQVTETSPVVLPSKFMQLTPSKLVEALKASGFKCQTLGTKISCIYPETNFPCTDYYRVTIKIELPGNIPFIEATKFTNCS